MGFASYHEDNLDARSESLRDRYHYPILSKENTTKKTVKSPDILRKKSMESQFKLERRSNSTHTPRSKQRQKASRQKALGNTRQDIRRRKLQKTQHVPVQKIQFVTTEEIEWRIQREMIRQSRLKE